MCVVDDYLSDDFIAAASRVSSTLVASTTKRRPISPVSMTPPSNGIKRARASSPISSVTSTTTPLANGSMEQRRTHGLSTAIPSTNVGYRLLALMGYRLAIIFALDYTYYLFTHLFDECNDFDEITRNSDGMGLGKQEEGRAVPVEVSIPQGRSGVGRDQHIKAQHKRKEDIKTKYEVARMDHFRQHSVGLLTTFYCRSLLKSASFAHHFVPCIQSSRFTYKRAQEDLTQCKQVCQTLGKLLVITWVVYFA
jgi:hypothetical protein